MDPKANLTEDELHANSLRMIAAAKHGQHHKVAQLAPISDGTQTLSGRTALMLAAERGHMKCVEVLLPISNVKQTTPNGSTALMLAAYGDQIEAVRALIPLSNVAGRDGAGQTALHQAAIHQSSNIVDVLLRAGADASARDNVERTPLFHAAMHGSAENVKSLLGSAMCDPNCHDSFGMSPLNAMAGRVDNRSIENFIKVAEALLPVTDIHKKSKRGVCIADFAKIDPKNEVDKVIKAFVVMQNERQELSESLPSRGKTAKPSSRSL